MFLLIIVVILCLLPFAYPLIANESVTEENIYDDQLAELKAKQQDRNTNKFSSYSDEDRRPYDHPNYKEETRKVKGSLFYFDPNTASSEDWKKLGLRDKTIAIIENYRSKGGKFRQPDDIKKIWGLFPDEAERLIPYVRINTENNPAKEDNTYYADNSKPAYEKKKTLDAVDINSSDTSAWIALPGIGTKLSQRIINFRNKLGGFYKVEQVAETFGLPDSVFQKIKPMLRVSGEVEKININTATSEELKAHPYISYQLANAIIQYRNQHGEYKSVDDIKKIMIVDDIFFDKASPYFSISQ